MMAFTHYVATQDLKRGTVLTFAEQGDYPLHQMPIRILRVPSSDLASGILLKDVKKGDVLTLKDVAISQGETDIVAT